MRIVQDRSNHSEPIDLDCPKCKSSLIADSPQDFEVTRVGASNWGGENGEKRYVVPCPVCKKDILVPKDQERKISLKRRAELTELHIQRGWPG